MSSLSEMVSLLSERIPLEFNAVRQEIADIALTPGPAGDPGLIVLGASDPDPSPPLAGVLYVRKVS